jgi:Flp pilus assembly protein TadG
MAGTTTMLKSIRNGRARQAQSGAALVEMALVTPILALMIFAVIQYGWLMMSMNMLTAATSAGVQVLSSERGFSTPHTDTLSQIRAFAPTLSSTDLTLNIQVDGVTCASNDTCALALSASQGKAATVSLSYAYTPIITEVIPMGLPSVLNVSMTGRIQ